jgi:hypothetical protein
MSSSANWQPVAAHSNTAQHKLVKALFFIFIIALQPSVEFQNIPNITFQVPTDFIYRAKSDALRLAAPQDGQIRLCNANQAAQFFGGHISVFQNIFQKYFYRHDIPSK